MNKILIICPFFAPQAYVGGVRPTMFAKYLTLQNMEVWVLTRYLPSEDKVINEGMSIALPENLKERVIRISTPDEESYLKNRSLKDKIKHLILPEYSSPAGFYEKALPIGRKLISEQKFDLILSSAPDQWGVTLGEKLAEEADCKFVVDFRDIYEQEMLEKRPLRVKLHEHRMLIRRYLCTRRADLIITVSEFHKSILSKKLGKKTEVVFNGYDDEFFNPSDKKPEQNKFTISYLGRILSEWYHNPTVLFQALTELRRERKLTSDDFQVNFYGVDYSKIIQYLTPENKVFVNFLPRIPLDEVVSVMNNSHALLLITNQGREGVLTTKFFEYAGVKKPIICVPGDSSELDALIKKHQVGEIIDSVDKMKVYLTDAVQKYLTDTWRTKLDSDPSCFTRKNQTLILANHLKSLV
ncbi:glycosyltransferase [Algoriphagus sp. Y33]|uniref:glycosyltransferase n=1 Tax=Algoriphagus sp. Y33 TaxID=2772483 RepID=UPI00177D5BDB|nr:glycosyltransferase [Algoriphagus sp. Y33]